MGPIIILDKSAIQSLSQNEIIFLFKHFYINVPPILLLEILADLKKFDNESMSEEKVTILSNKLLSGDSKINVYYRNICFGSLQGKRIPMTTGQILINDGVELETKDGEKALYIDESVEEKALMNWKDGQFSDSEKLFAGRLRALYNEINLDLRKKNLKELLKGNKTKISNFMELGLLVEERLSNPNQDFQLSCIKAYMNELCIPENLTISIYNRWLNDKKPPFRDFAPYAFYCFKVRTIFDIGLFYNLVPTRRTNLIDLEYFYYLPFCMVFCSGDKFHKDMSVTLLRDDQMFLGSLELKSDLHMLAEEWKNLNEEEKNSRFYEYGSYPPEYPNSITNKLWKKHCTPRTSRSGNIRMSNEDEKKFMQHFKTFADAIDAYKKTEAERT